MHDTLPLPFVDALVFDAYGTLFDVHSVSALAESQAPGRGVELSLLWRTKQLEYTWLSSLMHVPTQPRDDFDTLTSRALDVALESLGISLGADARRRLCDAYRTLAPFPEAAAVLATLAPRPRWILSNGTLAALEPLLRHSGLDRCIDGVLSVDAAGIFKPSPRTYQLAVDRLARPPERIGFVSSNCWDAIGAKAFGFVTVWINRSGVAMDRHGPAPDRTLASLSELPGLLSA